MYSLGISKNMSFMMIFCTDILEVFKYIFYIETFAQILTREFITVLVSVAFPYNKLLNSQILLLITKV